MSYFFPRDVDFQLFTKKSSRCLSRANSDGSSIVGSFEIIVDLPFPVIRLSISSSYFEISISVF